MPTRQVPEVATRVADAAARLFLERGYVGTTIVALAEAAGVAVQTIYNVVGSKSDVLELVLDRAVSGPHVPRPVPEFMHERSAALDDAEEVVGLLAEWFVEVHARSGWVFQVIREAAAVDADVASLEQERERRRLVNYRAAAEVLAEKGPVRLGDEETAAVIWSLGHPQVYRRLVLEGDWPPTKYREWIRSALRGALLE
jgi:AcrR family transcriptional regulator